MEETHRLREEAKANNWSTAGIEQAIRKRVTEETAGGRWFYHERVIVPRERRDPLFVAPSVHLIELEVGDVVGVFWNTILPLAFASFNYTRREGFRTTVFDVGGPEKTLTVGVEVRATYL